MKNADEINTGIKLHPFVRAVRVATLSATLVWSVGASAADMCGGDANFFSNNFGRIDTTNGFYVPNFAGVTLNKTLTLLNDVDQVRGASDDPVRGEDRLRQMAPIT